MAERITFTASQVREAMLNKRINFEPITDVKNGFEDTRDAILAQIEEAVAEPNVALWEIRVVANNLSVDDVHKLLGYFSSLGYLVSYYGQENIIVINWQINR